MSPSARLHFALQVIAGIGIIIIIGVLLTVVFVSRSLSTAAFLKSA